MNAFEANKKALPPIEARYHQYQDRATEHIAVLEGKMRADIQALFPDIWLDAQRFIKTDDNAQKRNIGDRYALPQHGELNRVQEMKINIFTQACNLLMPPIK